jgi:hypothetical protein
LFGISSLPTSDSFSTSCRLKLVFISSFSSNSRALSSSYSASPSSQSYQNKRGVRQKNRWPRRENDLNPKYLIIILNCPINPFPIKLIPYCNIIIIY